MAFRVSHAIFLGRLFGQKFATTSLETIYLLLFDWGCDEYEYEHETQRPVEFFQICFPFASSKRAFLIFIQPAVKQMSILNFSRRREVQNQLNNGYVFLT